MGQSQSSEANGVNCLECGCGLPANNWSFVHLGDNGWVYVFYTHRSDEVEVVESIDLGANKDGVSVGLGNQRKVQNVKVLQYIRNKCKQDGYTCLNCLVNNCKAGYLGWDRIAKETNTLLREHGIKVEAARLPTEFRGVPIAYLKADLS